ncbi:MAG: hypothetical protein KDC00_12820 [Flavobacteriales bacterium]|nr:hypothetical protein [Flavobacteriales bacterium]
MTLYSTPLALAAIFSWYSCGSAPNDGAMAEEPGMDELAMAVAQRTGGEFATQDMPEGAGSSMQQPTGSGKIVMHPVKDPKTGMVASQMPLPDTWRMTTPKTAEDPHIIGPNGIKVFYRGGASHMYSNDPYMQQSYQMAGQRMRAPLSIEQLIQQDLAPNLKREGLQFVKNEPLPEVARRNQQYASKLYKVAPSNDSFHAMGSEWLDKEGKPVLIIVNQMISQGQQDVFWYYNLQVLTSDKPAFEDAKRALVYGIANTQDNPQQIAAYNANEQQKANQSWSQHNTRMQQNQAAFDQQQAIHRSTSDAVNNSIMGTWNAQQAASDRGQQDFINTMRGEETVTNPADGQRYQVESGANQYWMNANGDYIMNNDAFYDPNADPNINNQDWNEVTPE